MRDVAMAIPLEQSELLGSFEQANGGKAAVMGEVDRIIRVTGWDRGSAIAFIDACVAAGATRLGDVAPLFAACRRGQDALLERLGELAHG